MYYGSGKGFKLPCANTALNNFPTYSKTSTQTCIFLSQIFFCLNNRLCSNVRKSNAKMISLQSSLLFLLLYRLQREENKKYIKNLSMIFMGGKNNLGKLKCKEQSS